MSFRSHSSSPLEESAAGKTPVTTADVDAELFAERFSDLFDISCNGRWPRRNHRPYTPTVEEEMEDIQLRARQPRLLPSIDDLVLAQEERLERSQIRRLTHVLGAPPWTFIRMINWIRRPPGEFRLNYINEGTKLPGSPADDTPKAAGGRRPAPLQAELHCSTPLPQHDSEEVITINDSHRKLNNALHSPVKRLRVAHRQILGHLGSLEGVATDDIAIQVELKKRNRPQSSLVAADARGSKKKRKVTMVIPLDLSNVEPANNSVTVCLRPSEDPESPQT